jgi:hypothetical protein
MYHLRRKQRERPSQVSKILTGLGMEVMSADRYSCRGVSSHAQITVLLNNKKAVFSVDTNSKFICLDFSYGELLDTDMCVRVLKASIFKGAVCA